MCPMINSKQIIEKYGNPGELNNLVSLTLPYPFLLDWDLNTSTSKMVCHKLVADQFRNIFTDILSHYGITKITELGINQTGGCFMNRPKRGYESQFTAAIERGDKDAAAAYLSTHSWAIAIDLDPNRNLLRETAKTARFARPEYKPMIDIFYAHGFLSYGREKNYDWMHFETAN